jgi:hypothetical protein
VNRGGRDKRAAKGVSTQYTNSKRPSAPLYLDSSAPFLPPQDISSRSPSSLSPTDTSTTRPPSPLYAKLLHLAYLEPRLPESEAVAALRASHRLQDS